MSGIREKKDTYKHRTLEQRRRDKWIHKHRQGIAAGIICGICVVVIIILLVVI